MPADQPHGFFLVRGRWQGSHGFSLVRARLQLASRFLADWVSRCIILLCFSAQFLIDNLLTVCYTIKVKITHTAGRADKPFSVFCPDDGCGGINLRE